jgi:hypothetical protein
MHAARLKEGLGLTTVLMPMSACDRTVKVLVELSNVSAAACTLIAMFSLRHSSTLDGTILYSADL